MKFGHLRWDYKNVLEVPVFLDLPTCLNAGDVREPYIHQDYIRTMGADRHEAFLTRGSRQHFVPCFPEERDGREKKAGIVVDDKYFCCININYYTPSIKQL